MNEIAIMLLAPIIAGVLAWLLDIKRVREIVGVIGAAVPLIYIVQTYQSVFNGGTINLDVPVGGFTLSFALYNLTWFFAAIAALLGFTMALGMASTSKDGYEWLFALMSMTGVLGVFMAREFVSFFLFWELMTFASFMMVLKYNRSASLKYFILSVIGAYAMLIAIGILYAKTGSFEFSTIQQFMYQDATKTALGVKGAFGKSETILLYLLFLTAFGVKAGAFPLHVWAPDAYSETNQSYTSFFSGVLSKAGVYGFVLLYSMMGIKLFYTLGTFGGHSLFAYTIAWIGALTVVIASFLAVLQEDIRKLFAYSSVGQVGYVLLGIGVGTQLGFEGALFHALSHAIFKGLFWLVVAALILQTGKTEFKDFGGLAKKMPITFAFGLIAVLSLAGIPPLAGFASKWILYEAAISAKMPLVAGAIFLGSGLAFAYVVRFLYAVWFGQMPSDLRNVKEAPLPLLLGMALLGMLNLVFGIAPGLVTKFLNTIFGHEVITGDIYTINTGVGNYNALMVAICLVAGIVIAGVLFLYGAKTRKVEVNDTYQSGNPVTQDFNLSIRVHFYKPLEEALSFWLRISFDKLYTIIAKWVEDFAEVLKNAVYNGNVQSYAWYLGIILLILALWGW